VTDDPDVRLDASNLRGIAHPLRVRALGLLRRHGPATATQLAARMGQSSGALSYHLRQLAAYGFIEDDGARGNGRERWWRAVHRATRYDGAALLGEVAADEEVRAQGVEYLRAVGRIYADRIVRFTDALDTLQEEAGAEWAESFTLSDWPLQLTPERARTLFAELDQLLDRYRDASDAESSTRGVTVQLQLFPVPEP